MPAPWLGIQGIADSGAIAKGVRVLTVHPDSPAEGAKLKGDKSAGDVILAVAGTPVTSPEGATVASFRSAVGGRGIFQW